MLSKIIDLFKKVLTPVSIFLTYISSIALVFVVLIVVADVFMRRVFNSPISGVYELSGLAFSMVVFLPLSWCCLNNNHVELGLVVERLSIKKQNAIEVIMILLTVCMVTILGWRIWVQGYILQTSGAVTALLQIPVFPFVYTASFGCFILALTFTLRLLKAINTLNTMKGDNQQ